MNKSELIIMRKIVALQQKLKDIAFTGLYSDLIGSPIVPSIESNYNNIEFVDLDLPSGTSWAIKNIGAEHDYDVGLYFAWGDTTGYEGGQHIFNRPDYYNVYSDAANVIMGGSWTVPTKDQIEELLSNTTKEVVENYNDTGINGILFTGKNGNTMFIPNSGYYYKQELVNGDKTYIHSSTLSDTNPYYLSNKSINNHVERYYGKPIRGVVTKLSKQFHIVAFSGDYNNLINRPDLNVFATKEYVDSSIASSSEILDTLREIQEVLENDDSLTSLMEAINTKASITDLEQLRDDINSLLNGKVSVESFNSLQNNVNNLSQQITNLFQTINNQNLSIYLTKEEFYNYINPLEINITRSSQTLLEYTGQPIELFIDYEIHKGNNLVTPTSLVVDGSNVNPPVSSGTYTNSYTILGTKTIRITATYGEETKSLDKSFKIVRPTYYGFSSEDQAQNINLSNLTKILVGSITMNQTIENNIANRYLWIVTQFSINKVATDNGFSYPVAMETPVSIGGLKYYRSSDPIDICNLTYYIK